MKKIIEAYSNTSLILRIVIGLIIGVLLALWLPNNENAAVFVAQFTDQTEWVNYIGDIITMFGTLFTTALKAVAPILVFFLVSSSLSTAKGAGNMKTVVVLYLASTVIAGLLAVIASYISPSTLVFTGVEAAEEASAAPMGLNEVLGALFINAFSNPIDALANANYLGILVWAILLGIAFRSAKQSTKDVLTDAAHGITVVVRWIINCAPFGIMGLIYASVTSSGLDIFLVYGHLVVVLVIVILAAALITNPLLVALVARINPYPLIFRCLKESAVMAFFTRSSAANIPVNMQLCEDLGLDEDNFSVSIPLGATINMAGACITISIMTMATANTLGITVNPLMAIILCVLAAISACGASGVAGGSLLLIPLACSLFGIDPAISAQVVGVGFIIGVIQDSCETALNSSSDVVFTATAEIAARRKLGLSTTLPIPENERIHGVSLDEPAKEEVTEQ